MTVSFWLLRRQSLSQQVPSILLCILAVLYFGYLTLCLVDVMKHVGEPFAGFWVSPQMTFEPLGLSSWTGYTGGLHNRDRLIMANERPISAPLDLENLVRQVQPGKPILYSIEREGRQLMLEIPSMVLTFRDALFAILPGFVTSLIFFGLGILVVLMKPGIMATSTFLAACYCYAWYLVSSYGLVTGHRAVYRSLFFANYLLPAAIIHLSMVFPVQQDFVRRWPVIQLIPYVVSLIPASILVIFYPNSQVLFLRAIYDPYKLAAVGIFIALSLYSWLKGSTISYQRAKVICCGFSLTIAPSLLAQILMKAGLIGGGTALPVNQLALLAAFFPAFVAYAIVKHNLFDVDTYIKRTVGYVLMTGIVAGGYFVFQTVVKTMVLDPLIGSASEQVYPLLFALLTVFAFNPLSQQVQQLVDKMFFRKAYDYKATVAKISDALTSLLDLNAFIGNVMRTVQQNLFVDKTGVILLDSRKHACESVFLDDVPSGSFTPALKADPCLTPDDPLLTLLAREKKLITKYDVAEDPKYAGVRESCGRRFAEMGASLALPLFYHDKFTGLLALGHKKSGHFYTREDIDLLQTLSSMTSTAIEQVREKDQRATLMQLFSKHVSPSVAETLWEQREHFMEGGRPKSQSMMVTAMFTDLQGFSTLSEKQSPELLMGWLNTYLEMMTNTVMEYGGVVDDFFGDGVKINFGVPVPRESETGIRQDAINAVRCALAMEQRMRLLNTQMTQQGQQPLRMRVGIYTGPVVAGSLGSADRMKYTTIGDTVNTAARLESFDKDLVVPELEGSPCRILIGGTTLSYVAEMFRTKFVGELSLKGKQDQIPAYCVLAEKTAEVTGPDGLRSEDSAVPYP